MGDFGSGLESEEESAPSTTVQVYRPRRIVQFVEKNSGKGDEKEET